ncbi:hypothetical protein DE146DRAFT_738421 [Phaeosphaeria sp. MPI-PUGE-AT-0046c]|nr:hypothetical protein DE146DRAFT_738421 [Phaeosphaeria sp. MPI-PUGE-AT-0046c]
MSDSVPCHQPYEPQAPRAEGDTVVLHIGRGSETEHITASVALLCRGSEYFYDRLSNRDADMTHLPLSFPSEAPALFCVFLTFLTTGELRHSNLRSSTRPDIAMAFIVELFAFSAEFSATTFRNALLDAFFLHLASPALRLRDVPVCAVYEATSSSSSLRDMLVTVVVNTGDVKDVERCEDRLPKRFLVDCLKAAEEDDIVPFGKSSREGREWMDWKMERVCKEYHVHHEDDEDDDMMLDNDGDKDMDGDDRDDGRDRGEGEIGGKGKLGISEKTQRELAFIEGMRKLNIRY